MHRRAAGRTSSASRSPSLNLTGRTLRHESELSELAHQYPRREVGDVEERCRLQGWEMKKEAGRWKKEVRWGMKAQGRRTKEMELGWWRLRRGNVKHLR